MFELTGFQYDMTAKGGVTMAQSPVGWHNAGRIRYTDTTAVTGGKLFRCSHGRFLCLNGLPDSV